MNGEPVNPVPTPVIVIVAAPASLAGVDPTRLVGERLMDAVTTVIDVVAPDPVSVSVNAPVALPALTVTLADVELATDCAVILAPVPPLNVKGVPVNEVPTPVTVRTLPVLLAAIVDGVTLIVPAATVKTVVAPLIVSVMVRDPEAEPAETVIDPAVALLTDCAVILAPVPPLNVKGVPVKAVPAPVTEMTFPVEVLIIEDGLREIDAAAVENPEKPEGREKENAVAPNLVVVDP